VEVVDFLRALPAHLGPGLRRFYRFQIRYLPSSYERTYKLWFRAPWLWKPFVRFEHLLAGRRVCAWVRDFEPDVVVSVYPFSSLVLGELRRRGRIDVPVVTFLTDFAVHPRWIHPSVDLHLAVHPQVAADAVERSHGAALAPGPLVGPAFTDHLPSRQAARAALGIPAEARMVLVVAGSWAVGNVEETVETISAAGRYLPVTLCGSDTGLQRRLHARGLGVAVGWTDQVPAYVASADVLVENAGGLSFLEACASQVPVITYDPIAGHGKDNARAMERAGVAYVPTSPVELLVALDELSAPGPARDVQVHRALAMFRGDAADEVVRIGDAHRRALDHDPATVPSASWPGPEARDRRRNAAARARRRASKAGVLGLGSVASWVLLASLAVLSLIDAPW
jgi:UDP-N-acetylglucosamine:LPS N-acetylglucosamine transferase